MRIGDLESEIRGGRKRVSATVQWEDCDRPTYELYFETDESFADGFFCNPHAFFLGCVIPAFHFGEKRISIREEICPELLEGMDAVMRLFRRWYYSPEKKLLEIDVVPMPPVKSPKPVERSGFFFSGGVDSLATFCANRLNYPADHPRFIKDGFVVFGLEQDDPELFEHVLTSIKKFDGKNDLTIIPVYTNVYLNFRQEDASVHFSFWEHQFGGAALAAVAHCFAQRVSAVSIASTWDTLKPWGSHPIIDHNFSSSDMRIIHDGVSLTRLDKVKLVAGWDMALQNLRVCNRFQQYSKEMLNCGECEKCVRTMLGLLAVDALDRTGAFPVDKVTGELVRKNAQKMLNSDNLGPIYAEFIPELIKKERYDLVRAIEETMTPSPKKIWKSKIIQFDKKYLASSLVRLKNRISQKGR
jgi:hypothetical protein